MADGSDANALVTGLAVAGVVIGINSVHLPTVAAARASSPGNKHMEAARMSSSWTAAVVVVGSTVLARMFKGSGYAATIFVIGGTVVIALDFAHRMANSTDNKTGKLVGQGMDATAPPVPAQS